MSLAHVMILNDEMLKKDPHVVPEQTYLIILDINSVSCMDNNDKYNKQSRHIARQMMVKSAI